MGRSRYKYFTHINGPYFITCTIINWLPFFSIPAIVSIILESLKFMIRNERFVLHGFVIMENHLHLIVSGENISKEVRNFKSYTARMIINYLLEKNSQFVLSQLKFFKKLHKHDQEYQFWEEGSHPKLITSLEMLNQKLTYLHHNPVRRGYIDDPMHWRYSSYRNYIGIEGLLPVEIIGL
ncbi:transposase [candidate division KSB1 bacterium]|nr:transposase [candidate division KSB1 bacterium]